MTEGRATGTDPAGLRRVIGIDANRTAVMPVVRSCPPRRSKAL
jgi:hypothetical protein